MRRFLTLSCALAALNLAVPALAQNAPSPAPTPGEVLGAASDAMLEITMTAGNAQQQIAVAVTGRLDALADDGASDERLAVVAHRGVSAIRDVAGAARSALNGAAARAAGLLEAIGAPDVFFHNLRDLRAAAGERLRHSTRERSRAVLAKLRELVGEDDPAAAL